MSQSKVTTFFPNKKRQQSSLDIPSKRRKLHQQDQINTVQSSKTENEKVKPCVPLPHKNIFSKISSPREDNNINTGVIKNTSNKLTKTAVTSYNGSCDVPHTLKVDVSSIGSIADVGGQNVKSKVEELTISKLFVDSREKTFSKDYRSRLKNKLVNSDKILEVQKRLKQFSGSNNNVKLKSIDIKEKLKSFEKLKDKVESTKNNRSISDPSDRVPAYERFHTLASSAPPGLTLPYKYKLLLDLFSGMDTISSMMHNRAETVTFSKLKNAVQTLTRRSFEVSTVAKIKTVYPTSYAYQQEKGLMLNGKINKGYQLTIAPNLTHDSDPAVPPNEKQEGVVQMTGLPLFTSSKMLRRKSIFHHLLLDFAREHHQGFLNSLAVPVSVENDKLTRWHPEFELDNVPDITEAALPKPPQSVTLSSAQEVLDVARNHLPDRSIKALESLTKADSSNISNSGPSNITGNTKMVSNANTSPNKVKGNSKIESIANSDNRLKGVSSSLLERIRKKESAKIESLLTRSPAQDRHSDMLARLPSLARIIRTLFVTQKKPALPIEIVTQNITDSYKSTLGIVESEAHLRLLTKLLPRFCSVVKISSGTFVKLDRNQDLTSVLKRLEKEYEQSK